ncbi:MAG: hypothetical protein JWP48_6182 [Actinoallomurus sp.]|jgi:hypothetical protein|nr:hypothetical protein [Actinoallomurus sp.]
MASSHSRLRPPGRLGGVAALTVAAALPVHLALCGRQPPLTRTPHARGRHAQTGKNHVLRPDRHTMYRSAVRRKLAGGHSGICGGWRFLRSVTQAEP